MTNFLESYGIGLSGQGASGMTPSTVLAASESKRLRVCSSSGRYWLRNNSPCGVMDTVVEVAGQSHLNFDVLNMGMFSLVRAKFAKYGFPYLDKKLVYMQNCPYIQLFRQQDAIALVEVA